METRPYYNSRLVWSNLVGGSSQEGKIERGKLLQYYYNLLTCDLKIDTWFGSALTIDHINDLFTRYEKDLTEKVTSSQYGIPFLPTIDPSLWTAKTTLKLIGLLEYDNQICFPTNFQYIQDDVYDTYPLPTQDPLQEPIYFLGDIEILHGRYMTPCEYRNNQTKNYTSSAHLLSLQDMCMLLYAHPTIIKETSFIAGGTSRITGEPATYYPLFEYDSNKKEFVCKDIVSSGHSKETCIPVAYDIFD